MVLATVIASSMSRVVTTAGPLPCIIVGTPMGVEGVMRVTVVAEMLMHRDHGVRLAALPRLVD